jgi:intraflagellar transport protein 56
MCTLDGCRLQDGKAAEAELRGLAVASGGKHTEHDLIRHNLVVFRGGEGAQQVRPCLCCTCSISI